MRGATTEAPDWILVSGAALFRVVPVAGRGLPSHHQWMVSTQRIRTDLSRLSLFADVGKSQFRFLSSHMDRATKNSFLCMYWICSAVVVQKNAVNLQKLDQSVPWLYSERASEIVLSSVRDHDADTSFVVRLQSPPSQSRNSVDSGGLSSSWRSPQQAGSLQTEETYTPRYWRCSYILSANFLV